MFTTAKCGHCGKSGTKAQVIEPASATYKHIAICCQWCNAILGVTGYYDAGAVVKGLEATVERLERQISQIDHNVVQIGYALNNRR